MVNRIFSLLNKEFRGVNEAALLIGGFALASQVLGLFRDRMLAKVVGVGDLLDVYYAAFRIPDFLYISIASLASITVIMPFVVEKMSQKENGKELARIFLSNVFSAYMIFMLFISIIFFIIMPYIVSFIAPGFNDSQTKLLIDTSRIMLLSPIFIGLSNLIGTITQLFKNFLVFSLSPVFYNLGILFGVIFLYRNLGVYGLATGVVLGAIFHFLIQIPVVYKHGFFPKFFVNINWSEIFKVVKTSLPRTIALSSSGIAFLVLIAIASTLKSGSISLFTFSFNLQSVPLGIIGVSYSVAAFPILVQSFSSKDLSGFFNQIVLASKQIIFWSIPVMALFVVLRAQIVRVILGSSSFTWADTRLTAAAIALFVISLTAQSLILLFVRGYYASGNTKKPLFINVFSSLVIIVLAFFMINLFRNNPILLNYLENMLRVKDVPGTIMLALPLSYTIGSILNFFLIFYFFKRDFITSQYDFEVFRTFRDSLISALVVGMVAYINLSFFANIFETNTGWGIFFQGLSSGIMGIISGIFILIILKNKEFSDLKEVIKNKFSSNRVLAPEQSDL